MWARVDRAERKSIESQVPQGLGWSPQTRARPPSRTGSDQWPRWAVPPWFTGVSFTQSFLFTFSGLRQPPGALRGATYFSM